MGFLLILLGIAAIAVEQISYTRREKVIDIGPLEAVVEKEAHCFRLPIVFGVLVIISGIALLVLERRRSQ